MKQTHSWFWGVLKRYTPLYGHVLIASLVVNLLSLSMPLFIMNVYDRIVPNNAFESLWVLAIGMGIAACLDFVLRIARTHFVDAAGRNADIRLQGMFMRTLMDTRLDALYAQKETSSVGAIVARVRELEYVRDFLGSSTILAITDLPFIILFILLMFFIGGSVGIIPLIAIPILLTFSILIQKNIEQNSTAQMNSNAQKQSFLTEVISSLETIRVTRMEKTIAKQWDYNVAQSADATIHSRFHSSLSSYGMVLFNMFLSVSLVILGVYRISEGLMTTGALIACVILFGRCASPINALINILANFQKTRLALKQLDTLLNLPSENPKEIEENIPHSSIAVPIIFERVTFNYPGKEIQTTALKDISMNIPPGAKVGFLGASGSGKSTLARLCAGLYIPTEGRVMLGPLDMRNAPLRPYRNKLGFLPQEIRIFRGTLRHNIAMAWPHEEPCDEENILQAATLAGVMDFASEHPLGLDMPIGENGTGLSGGQAQSVALARALLGNPHTIILDEPSAQMDIASEMRLVARLKPYLQDKTVIIFTHKITMLNLVDRVVSLKKGAVHWEASTADAMKQLQAHHNSLAKQVSIQGSGTNATMPKQAAPKTGNDAKA